MSDKSKIEWTDATWNPVTGCTKVSQGCKHCYAERDWKRLRANSRSVYYGRDFTNVQCHPERLDQPLRWRKPRRIFVNSMSDLFHEAVPDDFIDEVFAVMALADRHIFQILTKRPDRMFDYITSIDPGDGSPRLPGWREALVEGMAQRRYSADTGEDPSHWLAVHLPLPNVWLGVSVEDQATADERIPLLLETPAAVRWISAEPLLGEIDLRQLHLGALFWLDALTCNVEIFHDGGNPCPVYESLDWVVAGGESGPAARASDPDWFRSLREQCAAAGVPFLFKQWGEYLPSGQDDWNGNSQVTDADYLRVGKKRAGRVLDGREHNELPAQGGSRA